MKTTSYIFLSLYLGLAPIYWWPIIGISGIESAKILFLACALISVSFVALSHSRLSFPPGILGPVGFLILIIVSVSGLMQGHFSSSVSALKDYTLAFFMMWAFFNVRRMGLNVKLIFLAAAFIVSAHCILVALNGITGFPDWRTEFGNALWYGGFTSKRTGWSTGVALYAPVLVAALLLSRQALVTRLLIYGVATAGIVTSQFIVGGRSGLLAATVASVAIITMQGKRIWFLMVVVMVGLLAYLHWEATLEGLRAEKLTTGTDLEALDHVSSGRVEGLLVAWSKMLESPIFGHGYGNSGFVGEIHNLWLRLWVDAGIFVPIVLTILMFVLVRDANLCFRHVQASSPANAAALAAHGPEPIPAVFYRAVLLGGMVIALFEPAHILGAFHNSAIWWACAGAAAADALTLRRRRALQIESSKVSNADAPGVAG